FFEGAAIALLGPRYQLLVPRIHPSTPVLRYCRRAGVAEERPAGGEARCRRPIRSHVRSRSVTPRVLDVLVQLFAILAPLLAVVANFLVIVHQRTPVVTDFAAVLADFLPILRDLALVGAVF